MKVVGTVPRYTINLDLPGEERWDEVIEDYADQWLDVQTIIKQQLKGELGSMMGSVADRVLTGIMGTANKTGQVLYSDELKGIANKSGMKLGRVVLLQLVYEVSACCTSIVKEDANGIPHHIRTMDWGMEFLSPLTVELDFIRNGQLVFSATSWAGYVGVLTGMKPNAFSASVNFRLTEGGSLWTNIKNAMTSCWPTGFLLRDVLEDEITYSRAVKYLARSHLIAPCYYTCCGTKSGEGCIITRDVKAECERYNLEDGDVVQTNMDHFSENPDQDIMDSMLRRDLGKTLLVDMPIVSSESLWEVVSVDPIFNSITIYGTYMLPSEGILETRIPSSRHGFLPARIPRKRRREYVVYRPVDELSETENRRRRVLGSSSSWHLEYLPDSNEEEI